MAEPVQIFDRALIDQHQRRALRKPQAGADFLLNAAVDDLIERLAAVQRDFAIAADLATPLPHLVDRLAGDPRVMKIVRLDRLAETASRSGWSIAGDPEALPFAAESLDLVVSALALQWVSDLPGVLAQVQRALRPDGLFLANLLGGDTLHELRESLTVAEIELTGGAAPRVAPFADLRQIGALLQRASLALPVVDQDRLTVRYENAFGLMRDLRAMGAANALVERSRRPLRRQILLRAAEVYRERFADPDGRIRATFDIISLSGWAPHESQQKPLRPGSARRRLADALGVAEQSAGEKAGRRGTGR
jgi:SAM-dependent methyltransferase